MEGAISIREAPGKPGWRLVLLEGVPSPWGQAAKGIFETRGLPLERNPTMENDAEGALRDGTGQNSYPAAMFEDEAPRSSWAEILLLAERLALRDRMYERHPRLPVEL